MTTPDPTIPRTVVALHAENFKRLKAVDITPEPGQPIVTISGANAQGKSSVLDALWSALESSAATKGTKTTRPVRDGEKKATVRVDLGDIIVTRTWTAGGTSKLEVTPADGGAAYRTPPEGTRRLARPPHVRPPRLHPHERQGPSGRRRRAGGHRN